MDMYRQIHAFYQLMEAVPLRPPHISLWFALLHTANRARWPGRFAVLESVLKRRSGLNEQSLRRARQELCRLGLIHYETRGNQPGVYQLLPVDKAGRIASDERRGEADSRLPLPFPPAAGRDAANHTANHTANDTANHTANDTTNDTAPDTSGDTIEGLYAG